MLITGIRPIDKKRSGVYLDGEFAFVLYNTEIRNFAMAENRELPDSVYKEITETLLVKRCRLRAMNLLQKRDYTEKQLSDKLRDGMYPADIIVDAINYVKSYKYLDDERYARDYISYHMESRSKNRIIQDLAGKGIDRDLIISLVDEMYSDAGNIELQQIRRLLEKKNYDPENCDFKQTQKIMGFLLRKGFSISEIRKAMSINEYE